MAWAWTSTVVAKWPDKVMRALFLDLLQKLLLMKLMSMSPCAVLVPLAYHVSFASLHLDWTWKGNSSCSRWILSMLILSYLDSTKFARVFGHLKTVWKATSTMRTAVLIWHMISSRSHGWEILVTLVVVLTSMASGSTLWNKMSPSYLWSMACASTSCAIFAEVVESLWLLLLYKMAMLRIRINVAFWSNRWNKTRRALWTYSYLIDVASSLVVNLNNSWFVLLPDHILWLLHFVSFGSVWCNLLNTRCSSYWPPHWVTLFIAWSLAVISLFFDYKLILLSVSFLAVHFEILLMLTLKLLMGIVKTTKFLFTLIWCQFRIGTALRKNCWDWNSSTWIYFTLCNELICSWTLRLRCMTSLSTLWACSSNAWNLVEITFNRIFILTLLLICLWNKGILNTDLLNISINSTNAIWCRNTKITLSVKCTELRFVLDEVILTILKYSLVRESTNSCHSFSLRLSIFVRIFHLLFSLLHMTWSDWLHFLMKWTTQSIFLIFHIETCTSAVTIISRMNMVATCEVWAPISLIFTIVIWFLTIDIFLISQIETCSICHVHFETARCKTLSLGFLNNSDLFFWVTDRAIMFLRILLLKLILKRILVNVELLAIARDSWLTWVDRSLHSGNHIQQISIIIWISDVIKPGMLKSLFTSESICWVHLKQATHEIKSFFGQTAHISFFKCFRLWNIWEF